MGQDALRHTGNENGGWIKGSPPSKVLKNRFGGTPLRFNNETLRVSCMREHRGWRLVP
jgi:hypothetical protein